MYSRAVPSDPQSTSGLWVSRTRNSKANSVDSHATRNGYGYARNGNAWDGRVSPSTDVLRSLVLSVLIDHAKVILKSLLLTSG